jgi:hypothetical protein
VLGRGRAAQHRASTGNDAGVAGARRERSDAAMTDTDAVLATLDDLLGANPPEVPTGLLAARPGGSAPRWTR